MYQTSPLEQQIDVIYCAKGSICSRRSKATVLSSKDNFNDHSLLINSPVNAPNTITITNKPILSHQTLDSNSPKGEQYIIVCCTFIH